jgi:superfamily II DNA or RNA helicase
MTARPERSDGNDIYKIFEHNIAYEIRLHPAMAENMLCDFHYYGLTDLIIDGEKSRKPRASTAQMMVKLVA